MGKPKKKGGKLGKAFTLHHYWVILENGEKWRNRLSNEIPNKRKTPSTSSSLTPLSSVNRKRLDGRKEAKDMRAKGGDNFYKESLESMMAMRKELAFERRELRNKEIEDTKEVEKRKVAVEERRAAAEEKLAQIEESKVANEELVKRIENKQKIMFMNPSGLDAKGRAYLEFCHDQILMSRGFV